VATGGSPARGGEAGGASVSIRAMHR
jgi:hypothetical protein